MAWNSLPPDMICNPNEENEMSAHFMPNGSKQTGSMADTGCLYNIAEPNVLVSNTCGPNTAGNQTCVFQSEDFGIQVFRTKIKNVVVCITYCPQGKGLSSSGGVEKRRMGWYKCQQLQSRSMLAGNHLCSLRTNAIPQELGNFLYYARGRWLTAKNRRNVWVRVRSVHSNHI